MTFREISDVTHGPVLFLAVLDPTVGRTFSIYLCPLPVWLTLPRRVLSTSWCCPSRPCVAFLAFVHLALFLALSLSPGNSLVSSWRNHSMLASLLWQFPLYSSFLTRGTFDKNRHRFLSTRKLCGVCCRYTAGSNWCYERLGCAHHCESSALGTKCVCRAGYRLHSNAKDCLRTCHYLLTYLLAGVVQWRGERYDGTSTRTGPLQSKKK